jgi:aromatic-L-amino-acid decarboxylase
LSYLRNHINQQAHLPFYFRKIHPDMDKRAVPPMGMTGEQFRDAASSAIDEIERYYSTISSRPVLPSITPGYLRDVLPGAAPQQGEQWEAIASDLHSKIMPGVTHWQSPKFMAFFPASSTYPGILGEIWSAALTAPAFNWMCSPVVTELETVVLDWLAKILALPESFRSTSKGGGVIQGSASEAIVTVMIAARERFIRRRIERENFFDPEEAENRACELRSRLVALGSDQAHSSTKKAAIIAGTRYRNISASSANLYSINGEDLRRTVEELTAKDLDPYYLTVTIGTTNTCAVDDLESIASVAHDYPDIWLHCDAAYAGAALVLPEYHHLSAQLSSFDSFDVNMHKWLLVNFDASALYVQDRVDLTSALSITPAYLRNQFTDSGLVTDYRDWQIPLGRRFRALKIWFVLRTWGVEGMQAHVQYHIQLGELFASLVRSRGDLFSILTPPRFALTVLAVNAQKFRQLQPLAVANHAGLKLHEENHEALRLRAKDGVLEAANRATEAVYKVIDDNKRYLLTSTVLGEVFAIRVVSANPLAEERVVRELFDELVQAAESVLV